jgi:NAD+ diphosphatase
MDFNYNYHFQENIPPQETSYWFIFRDEKILTGTCGNSTRPLLIAPRDLPQLNTEKALHVGLLNNIHCYAVFDQTDSGFALPDTEWVSLRWEYGKFDDEMFYVYGRALHLLVWAQNNRFCGRCGNAMALKSNERCFLCPSCGFLSFPRISPAVIVSIEKDGKLLLARGKRYQSKMYSSLAGFVEPGESLEDCVRREIKEEVGIDVKNIQYFKSQPWPFPDSLMIAFTAEYAGGELSLDPHEILDAVWFSPEDFPTPAGKYSISRALIDHFAEQQRQKTICLN